MRRMRWAIVALFALDGGDAVAAEPVAIKAVMRPKEQIRFDFPMPDKHFVPMVRREGTVSGTGPFDGARGVEYGVHHLVPGVGGKPRGYYLLTAKDGAQAIIEWSVQATFILGPEGRPVLLDNGVWKFVGGTGALAGIQGARTMHIQGVTPMDREFRFEGEYVLPRR